MWTVFPAQAGVILLVFVLYCNGVCIPRASGGDPSVDVVNYLIYWYSPRKRG